MADDELDVEGWNAANPLHPRAHDGKFRDRLGAMITALANDFGEVLASSEFGEPDHHLSSHGLLTVHPGGRGALHAMDEDGAVSHIASDLDHSELTELSDSIHEALGLDPGSAGDSFDVTDVGGLNIGRGRTSTGDPYVSIENDDDSIMMSDGHAEAFVERANQAANRAFQEQNSPGDPSVTAPLGPGEASLRRKQLNNPNGEEFTTGVALVDTPNGIRVRLGAVWAGGDNGIKDWTGGRGKTTVDLDREHAEQIAAILEEFDRNGRERQKIYNRHIAAYDNIEKRGGDQAEYEAISDAVQHDLGGDFEDDYRAESVQTHWGTVRLTDVGMDDEANAHTRHVRLEIWPAGMSEAEYDAGNPDHASWAWPGTTWEKPRPDLAPKDARALIKILRESFADETGQSLAKSARAAATGNEGSAARLKRFWTRDKEGLTKWLHSAHPWTTLRRHLAKYIKDPGKLDRTTSAWFHAATGLWSGERKGRNPVGPG